MAGAKDGELHAGEVPCPDCGAPPERVDQDTGWAGCSRCWLSWPALEKSDPRLRIGGRRVPLPRAWRVRPIERAAGYRAGAERRVRVEIVPPARLQAVPGVAMGLGSWGAALATVLLQGGVVGPTAFVALGMACMLPAAGRVWRSPRVAAALEVDGDRVIAWRHDRAEDLGVLVELRAASGAEHTLVARAADAEPFTLVRGEHLAVESLLRDVARSLGLALDRDDQELVARPAVPRSSEPPRKTGSDL